mmetsp:Transcript_15890/g.49917  ORF Transcript_15890/g.49917 Transcript_15890/m.49917 type:complete len:301 (+) Transcript_15890:118-1020(+)
MLGDAVLECARVHTWPSHRKAVQGIKSVLCANAIIVTKSGNAPALRSGVPLVKHQTRVRAAETKGIRHHTVDRARVLLPEDLQAFALLDEVIDVGGLCEEAAVGHEQGVDGLVHTRSAQRVAREGLCRAHEGVEVLLREDSLYGSELLHVPHRRGRPVRVDVVDRLVAADSIRHGHGQLHAVLATHARGRHNVVAIRIGRVTDELGVDAGTTRLCVLEFLQNQHAAAPCNDKAVAVLVEGARGLRWVVVPLGRECPHAVKHSRELPTLILASTHKCHVGLVELDLLHASADAVGACRACR